MIIAVDFDNVIYDHDGVWRAGELTRDPVLGAPESLASLRAAGHKIVINSTRNWNKHHRERIAAWMQLHGIQYDEIPTHKPCADVYIDDKAMRFTTWPEALIALLPSVKTPMRVILYNVGRNLNRAYRTCYSFGVGEMIMVGKSDDRSIDWELKGNLFEAKDRVKVTRLDDLPDLSRAVAMENYYDTPLWEVNWSLVDTILIGGETTGLPRNDAIYKVKIPTTNQFCLTVEAALAIGLYEWQRASTISK